jgi:hypothetical protein
MKPPNRAGFLFPKQARAWKSNPGKEEVDSLEATAMQMN